MVTVCRFECIVQLHVFVQLQQDVQAKYPEFLTAVVSKVTLLMMQRATEEDSFQRLFNNLIHLCQWNGVPDSQQSARYSSKIF